MIKIEEINNIDKKHIALMDTSSISFMQSLQNKEEKCRRDIDHDLSGDCFVVLSGSRNTNSIFTGQRYLSVSS